MIQIQIEKKIMKQI